MSPAITSADEPLICEWLNCREASVDADGDVWVADPMVGHWLGAERKAAFLEWREAHQ